MLTKKRTWIGLAMLLVGVLLSSCGPSAEEQAATAVALTATAATSTPTVTPTSTPTPTPTPIPYDLTVSVTGDDAPIVGATVVLAEMEEVGTQVTDDVGQATWHDLPGETVNLSISAQGYFPIEASETMERGANQLAITLERDPFGILPSEACAPGESLLYIEDFQDGEAQGWTEIELRAQEWDIGPDPDSPGDIAIFRPAEFQGSAGLRDLTFDNAVWRFQFMPIGLPIFSFAWHWHGGGYDVEGTTVDWSSYQVWFHPPGLRVFRAQPPVSTITLRDVNRTIESGVWHQIEISTYEGTLEIWIDGVQFLTYDDPQPLPGGTAILGAGYGEPLDAQSVVYYDDLVVCELSAPFVPMPAPEPDTE